MHPISHTLRAIVATLLLAGLFVSCNKSKEEATPKSASDLIQEDNSFSLLRAAVLRANFADALKAANLTILPQTTMRLRRQDSPMLRRSMRCRWPPLSKF